MIRTKKLDGFTLFISAPPQKNERLKININILKIKDCLALPAISLVYIPIMLARFAKKFKLPLLHFTTHHELQQRSSILKLLRTFLVEQGCEHWSSAWSKMTWNEDVQKGGRTILFLCVLLQAPLSPSVFLFPLCRLLLQVHRVRTGSTRFKRGPMIQCSADSWLQNHSVWIGGSLERS